MTVRRVPLTYDTIQAAMANADPGDTILVACGVYVGSVTIDKPRLRIEGESPSCTILQGPGASGFNVTAPLVTITGFTVRDFDEGITIADTATDCTARNNRILNCNETGIFMDALRGLALGNVIENCPIGIALFEGFNYLIGNRIRNASEMGIDATGVNNVLVMRNRVVACYLGIAVSGSSNWINNNVVRNSVQEAIDVLSGDNHHLYGNICMGSGLAGLSLDGDGHVVVFNKLINNRGGSDSEGIDCEADGCILYGNKIVRNAAPGISVRNHRENNTLLANEVENNGAGIVLFEVDDLRILSNKIRGNGGAGIELGDHTDTTIVENNTVTANRANGVHVFSTGVENNAVRRNRLCGNRPFDIQVELPAFAQGNTFDLNTCNRSDPSNLCSRSC